MLNDAGDFELPDGMLENLREQLSGFGDERMSVDDKIGTVVLVILLYRGMEDIHRRMISLKHRALAGNFDSKDPVLRNFVAEFMTVLREGHEEEVTTLFETAKSLKQRLHDSDGNTDSVLQIRDELRQLLPVVSQMNARMQATADKLQQMKQDIISSN